MTGPVSGGIAALLQTGRFAGESVHFGRGRGAWKGDACGWRGRDRPALTQEGCGVVVRDGWRRVREGREGSEGGGLSCRCEGLGGGRSRARRHCRHRHRRNRWSAERSPRATTVGRPCRRHGGARAAPGARRPSRRARFHRSCRRRVRAAPIAMRRPRRDRPCPVSFVKLLALSMRAGSGATPALAARILAANRRGFFLRDLPCGASVRRFRAAGGRTT